MLILTQLQLHCALPSSQVECSASSTGGEWEDEEGVFPLLSSPGEEEAYTISANIDLCPYTWDHISSSPRLSETLVQIRAQGTVGGLTTNLQYACAVDSLHSFPVFEVWGLLFSLAVILLTAPPCSFTVYSEVDYATDSNKDELELAYDSPILEWKQNDGKNKLYFS